MKRLSDKDLEGINDTLAAAARDRAALGILPAELLHQLCCEVQAWRRTTMCEVYNPASGEIVEGNMN